MKRNLSAENRQLRAKLEREVERRKQLEKRLDAEILAREKAEEDLRMHRVSEHARASRASYGRPPVMHRNGQG